MYECPFTESLKLRNNPKFRFEVFHNLYFTIFFERVGVHFAVISIPYQGKSRIDPNCLKCLSKARTEVIFRVSMTTLLVQSVKLHIFVFVFPKNLPCSVKVCVRDLVNDSCRSLKKVFAQLHCTFVLATRTQQCESLVDYIIGGNQRIGSVGDPVDRSLMVGIDGDG